MTLGEESLLYLPGATKTSRALLLERMNKLVEIARLPPEAPAPADAADALAVAICHQHAAALKARLRKR